MFFKNKLYKTRKAHGNHPAGTICLASRIDNRTILLEYENGDFVEAHGMWCPGLEKTLYFYGEQSFERFEFEQYVIKSFNELIALEIDQQILDELRSMTEGLRFNEQARTELPKPPRKDCKRRRRKKR